MSESKKAAEPDKSEAVAVAIAAGVPSYKAWEMSDRKLASFAPKPSEDETDTVSEGPADA